MKNYSNIERIVLLRKRNRSLMERITVGYWQSNTQHSKSKVNNKPRRPLIVVDRYLVSHYMHPRFPHKTNSLGLVRSKQP
jgi:hypothetical protein